MIDKNYYRNLSISKPYNNAQWVKVEPAPAPTGKAWRAVCVHHLTGAENSGNHNVYVDLLDSDNKFLVNPQEKLAFSWAGQRHDERTPPVKLDKPANEPAGNIPVFKGAQISVWIDSPYPSDRVTNIITDLPDEDVGNTRFHHSYYVIFKLVDSIQSLRPTIPDIAQPVTPVTPIANHLSGVKEVISVLSELRTTIDKYLDELKDLQG